MTNPKPKAMSVEEAVDCLRHNTPWIEEADTPQMILERDTHLAALATLESLAESEAGLRAENERMKRTLTYQTNELGNTKERTRKLQADNIALKAEVERLTTERNSWKINATVFERDKKKAEADLARYRRYDKLIEAVGGPGEGVIEWDGRYTTKAAGDILRAALSCREEEK